MSHKLGYVLGSEVTVFTGICVAIQGAPVPISQRGDIGTTGALGGLGAGGRRFRGRLLGGPSGPGSAGGASALEPGSTTVFTGIMHGVVDFLLLAMTTVVLGDQRATAPPAGGLTARLPAAP